MKERRVDPEELAKAIAHRSVADDDATSEQGADSRIETIELRIDADFYVPLALKLLQQGETESAAALFEAAVALNESDAAAYNNLGFCLLPNRPKEALAALERAEELGFSPRLLNLGNRLYGLISLGRLSTALELASTVEAEWPALTIRRGSGYQWDYSQAGSSPVLRNVEDLALYVLSLIRHAASAVGGGLGEEWLRRTAEMLRALED